MYKLTSLALTAALGLAGVGQSVTAEARPCVVVGVGVPRVVVAPYGYAAGYYASYYDAHGPYWHPADGRYGHFYRPWYRR
jgi:hypothetical protein